MMRRKLAGFGMVRRFVYVLVLGVVMGGMTAGVAEAINTAS